MKKLLYLTCVLCLTAGTATAECKVADGLKWSAGGAIAGAAVAVIWGGALIAAPFTAGGSLGAAAATSGLTFGAITSALATSAGTAVVLTKVGAVSGAAVGAAVEIADCSVPDKEVKK